MCGILLLFILRLSASAEPLTVCEALENRDQLRGQVISVRGIWLQSDIGEVIAPTRPCKQPTIMEGWLWSDIVFLEGVRGMSGAFERARGDRRRSRYVVATFTGKFEMPRELVVWIDPFGNANPRGFGNALVRLRCQRPKDVITREWTVEAYADFERVRIVDPPRR